MGYYLDFTEVTLINYESWKKWISHKQISHKEETLASCRALTWKPCVCGENQEKQREEESSPLPTALLERELLVPAQLQVCSPLNLHHSERAWHITGALNQSTNWLSDNDQKANCHLSTHIYVDSEKPFPLCPLLFLLFPPHRWTSSAVWSGRRCRWRWRDF